MTSEEKLKAAEDETEVCACRYRETPRDAVLQRQLCNRLNRLIGQMSGIRRMVEENRYCGDILMQVAAVESALQSFGYQLLEDHLHTCVSQGIKDDDPQVLDETMELIRRLK